MNNQCLACAYYIYDEEYEEYICDCEMDEDDYYRVILTSSKNCPYYRNGDEYVLVRKQI